MYSIVKCLPLEHVCPRLSRGFLLIVGLNLELITIPYLNQKEEIGSYHCLGNVVHHRITYSGSFFPWIHEILWHSGMYVLGMVYPPTVTHISFQKFRCCSSGVSAECAFISIYFEAALHTTLSSQGFQGEKTANYRKESCIPLCGG